jgi:hypothetical protein
LSDLASFDSLAYLESNYRQLYAEDASILGFLVRAWRRIGEVSVYGEVGAGPNLYPALAALPHARAILLQEPNGHARSYLTSQTKQLDDTWLEHHWRHLNVIDAEYRPLDPQERLGEAVSVVEGFLGTPFVDTLEVSGAFFVTDCVSPTWKHFVQACETFVGGVPSGGHLLATFMEGSTAFAGSTTICLTADSVVRALRPSCRLLDVQRIARSNTPFRDGYSGIIAVHACRR